MFRKQSDLMHAILTKFNYVLNSHYKFDKYCHFKVEKVEILIGG